MKKEGRCGRVEERLSREVHKLWTIQKVNPVRTNTGTYVLDPFMFGIIDSLRDGQEEKTIPNWTVCLASSQSALCSGKSLERRRVCQRAERACWLKGEGTQCSGKLKTVSSFTRCYINDENNKKNTEIIKICLPHKTKNLSLPYVNITVK